jgi:hypothetical protein
MCRNIKPLFNFDPPATEEEIRDASLQFARKLSGFGKPSTANQIVIDAAVDEFSIVARRLLETLTTTSHPKNRSAETAKNRVRSTKRFGVS